MKIFKLILSGLFIFLCTFLKSQSLNLGKEINISNNDSFSGFEMLDIEMANSRLVLSGENHNYRNTNLSVEMKLFRYLVRTKGVKHLVVEQGYSLGKLMNLYITEGDSVAQKKLKNCVYQSNFRFYKNLRAFYLSLPDSQKFTINCIDIERFFTPGVAYLNYLLPNSKPIPEPLLLDIQSLKSLEAYYTRYNLANPEDRTYTRGASIPYKDDFVNEGYLNDEKTLKLFMRSFDSLNTYYQSYLGDKYTEFSKVIASLREKIYLETLGSSAQSIVLREQYIFKNFQRLANENPTHKFFGQFGRCHATDTSIFRECLWFDVSSFINRVNKSPDFTPPCKAFSIGLAYKNTYYEGDSKKGLTYSSEMKPYLKMVDDNQTMLFPIQSDTSNQFLTNRFKFILVSKVDISEIPVEGDSTVSVPVKISTDKIYDLIQFGFSSSQMQMNTDKLNSKLGKNGFGKTFESYGFNFINISKDEVVSGGFSFAFLVPHTTKAINDTSFSLRGANIGFQLGYDVLQKSRLFCLIPTIDIKYQQMKFIPLVTKSQSNFPYNNDPALDVYKNPGFLISPEIDLRVNFKGKTMIGIKGGYNFDLSNTEWKQNGKLRNSGANLSQSGLFFEGIVSFGYQE